jgi:hypothetical protein
MRRDAAEHLCPELPCEAAPFCTTKGWNHDHNLCGIVLAQRHFKIAVNEAKQKRRDAERTARIAQEDAQETEYTLTLVRGQLESAQQELQQLRHDQGATYSPGVQQAQPHSPGFEQAQPHSPVFVPAATQFDLP